MRKLTLVPLVHAEDEIKSEDLVSPAEKELMDLFWDQIRRDVGNLRTDGKRIKVFVDGVINVDRFLNGAGSTAQVVRGLYRMGARIILTEDDQLLSASSEILEKCRSQWAISDDPDLENDEAYPNWSNLLRFSKELQKNTQERDIFIAERIDSNLREGEIGILFMGATHRVENCLPSDVKVGPLSQEISDLNAKLNGEFEFEKLFLWITAKRDSFAPQDRGPERI